MGRKIPTLNFGYILLQPSVMPLWKHEGARPCRKGPRLARRGPVAERKREGSEEEEERRGRFSIPTSSGHPIHIFTIENQYFGHESGPHGSPRHDTLSQRSATPPPTFLSPSQAPKNKFSIPKSKKYPTSEKMRIFIFPYFPVLRDFYVFRIW